MPFSGPGDSKLPDSIKEKAESIRAVWVEVWNKTFSECQSENGSDCEGLAFRTANGVIKDNENMIIFKLNQEIHTDLVKEIIHTDGRTYLVAPTVAIVEGVMNEVLYTGDEINAYIDAWNGRPLIIEHPQDNEGEFVSANQPELLKENLGFYYNAVYEDNKLKGEWWLDIAKAEKSVVGQQVLNALRQGKLLEQSTGLFTDVEEKQGEFKGVAYTAIARNIRPDHVAILLHDEGACSIADGCGTPRVNKNEDNTVTLELKNIRESLKSYGKTLADFIKNFKIIKNIEGNQMSREEMIEWILQHSPVPLTRAMLELATDEELAQIGEAIAPPTEPSVLETVLENEGELVEGNEGEVLFTIPTTADPVVSPEVVNPASFSHTLPEPLAQFMDYLEKNGGLKAIQETMQERQDKQIEEFDSLMQLVTANSSYTKDDLEKVPVEFLRKMAMNIMTETGTMIEQNQMYGTRMFGINAVQNDSEWEVYGQEGQ